jgi:hypothetical protein
LISLAAFNVFSGDTRLAEPNVSSLPHLDGLHSVAANSLKEKKK